MITINIEKYESMIRAIVDALNLQMFDYEIVDDHIESIDMNFRIHENEFNAIDEIYVDNIESLYDAINDVIEMLRTQRYVTMKYKNDSLTITSNDDESFDANNVIFNDDNSISYEIVETFTIEQIDEFEKQHNLWIVWCTIIKRRASNCS